MYKQPISTLTAISAGTILKNRHQILKHSIVLDDEYDVYDIYCQYQWDLLITIRGNFGLISLVFIIMSTESKRMA